MIKRTRFYLAVFASLALPISSRAGITSFANSVQISDSSSLASNYFASSDFGPLTVGWTETTDAFGDATGFRASASASISENTAQSLEIGGNLLGDSYVINHGGKATILSYETTSELLSFNLDHAGILSLSTVVTGWSFPSNLPLQYGAFLDGSLLKDSDTTFGSWNIQAPLTAGFHQVRLDLFANSAEVFGSQGVSQPVRFDLEESFNVHIQSVPEPGTLVALGIGAWAAVRLRRKQSA